MTRNRRAVAISGGRGWLFLQDADVVLTRNNINFLIIIFLINFLILAIIKTSSDFDEDWYFFPPEVNYLWLFQKGHLVDLLGGTQSEVFGSIRHIFVFS